MQASQCRDEAGEIVMRTIMMTEDHEYVCLTILITRKKMRIRMCYG